jgi:plasmid stabilization system protein ParE
MSYRIILSPDAKADISSAVRWYQRRDLNVAFRFTLETRAAMSRIARSPYQFPRINGSIRRARLNRFPYYIYYALNKERGAFVFAVLHQRRNHSIWMDRDNGLN